MNSTHLFQRIMLAGKKVARIFTTLPVLLSLYAANAQVVPAIEWSKSLGGSASDRPYAIQQTADDGYIVAGTSVSVDGDITGNHGGFDYWITKLDNAGNLQWQRAFGGSDDEQANAIQQTTDGGYIIAGYTRSDDGDITVLHGQSDYWIIKLDSVGNMVWQKTFGGTNLENAESIRQTTDGGYIVGGRSRSINGDVTGNHGGEDFWIVKLDTSGNMEWEKSIGGSMYDDATAVVQTTDGGYAATGWSKSLDGDVTGNHGNYDYWTVKLDTVGNIQWEKSYGGDNYDQPFSMKQAYDGGYFLGGFTNSNNQNVSGNHGGNDSWIVKLDSNGNLMWQKCLGGSQWDRTYSVQLTSDYGVVVVGYTLSNDSQVTGNHGGYDYWVVKLDSSGNLKWQKCLGGTGSDEPYAVQQTADNGYVVAGFSDSNDGDVSGNHGSSDYWIVKLTDDIATETPPLIKSSISIFPNPVQSVLYVSFNGLTDNEMVHIYDLQGRMIILPMTFTNSQVQVNTTDLPGGFYTIKIFNNKTGENVVSKFIKGY